MRSPTLDADGATRSDFALLATDYAEAFTCYERGEFFTAARLFAALAPDDPPSRLLAERCTAFAAQPPAA